MYDMRLYSRLNVEVNCVIYTDDAFEINGTILNLSEGGVLIEFSKSDDLVKRLKLGVVVKMQGYDTLTYDDKKKFTIFNENMTVVRIETDSDKIKVACKVSERVENYRKYITDIKVADYVKHNMDSENSQ